MACRFYSLRRLGLHERLMPVAITESRGKTKITRTVVEPGVAQVYELSLIKKPDAISETV
jgi:hypothetical protein